MLTTCCIVLSHRSDIHRHWALMYITCVAGSMMKGYGHHILGTVWRMLIFGIRILTTYRNADYLLDWLHQYKNRQNNALFLWKLNIVSKGAWKWKISRPVILRTHFAKAFNVLYTLHWSYAVLIDMYVWAGCVKYCQLCLFGEKWT